jgi:hypothetical protein
MKDELYSNQLSLKNNVLHLFEADDAGGLVVAAGFSLGRAGDQRDLVKEQIAGGDVARRSQNSENKDTRN